MSTYKFDLDTLNKLMGTYIDIVNLSGGGIGLAAGLKLILDKGTGNVGDYYDSGNSRRVMTMGGDDALYLDATALDILGRLLKNPKGLGGSDGKRFVFADQYAGADMVTKIHAAAADVGSGGIVLVPPGNHTNCIQFEPANGVCYQGAGMNSTILKAAVGAAYAFKSFGVGAYEIRDLQLSGYAYNINGVYFYNSNSSLFRRVKFSAMTRVDVCISSLNRFIDCEFRDFYYECLFVRSMTSSNWFINNTFDRASICSDDSYAAVRLLNTAAEQIFYNCRSRHWGGNQAKYGFLVDAGCSRNEFVGGSWRGKTDDWLDNGTDTRIDLIHS